jgi:hypothetical protein
VWVDGGSNPAFYPIPLDDRMDVLGSVVFNTKEAKKAVNESEKAAKAAKQVEAITGFYIHVVVFTLVLALLFVVNWVATPEIWWVQWPFLGWGIGLLAHGLIVFSTMPSFITRWQLRKIKELKDRM